MTKYIKKVHDSSMKAVKKRLEGIEPQSEQLKKFVAVPPFSQCKKAPPFLAGLFHVERNDSKMARPEGLEPPTLSSED